MPDTLDSTGLTVKTLSELITELTDDLKTIYGSDINVASNTPDGQQINIYAQAATDLREVLQKIYTSFDPDQAEGRVLDQRVAINGIKRQEGTFTFVTIEVTTDRAVSLIGLDAEADEVEPDIENLYTVKDSAGTEFYLLASQSPAGAGTYSYTFRAADIGAVEVLPSTITTVVTTIAGVTAVNNPAGASSVGVDEESDNQLRVRRRVSTSIDAVSPVDTIEANIQDLATVTSAIVYENDTNVTDGDGIPPHSIWAIVEGGTDEDIADIIYKKKTAGCDTYGNEQVNITRDNGTDAVIYFDRPVDQDIYIQFSIRTYSGESIVEADIKTLIVANVFWEIGIEAAGSVITAYLRSVSDDYIIEDMEVSDDDITYAQTVVPTSKKHRFVNDTARITII